MKRARRKKVGKVWIVGAGPGDPDLLTGRATTALMRADLVLHDWLVHPGVLRIADSARFVDVGTRGGAPRDRMQKICAQMIRGARAGLQVVHLKGGDPMIFGRGAEECEALNKANVRFELVPGLSSATTVPELVGIPPTYRGLASSFAVVTGRVGVGGSDEPQWDLLAHATDTLIVLMGAGVIAEVAKRLIKAGKEPTTPIVAIQWGTWPSEVCQSATLETASTRLAGLSSPVILVIGKVAAMKGRWQSKMRHRALTGVRVATTTEASSAWKTAGPIEAAGGLAWSCPAIRTRWFDTTRAARIEIGQLATYDWLVFTSANALGAFMGMVRECKVDARSFPRTRIAAIGKETSHELNTFYELRPNLVPRRATSEGLLRALGHVSGKRILLPRAAEAREVLPKGLAARGAIVKTLPVYHTVEDRQGTHHLSLLVHQRAVDVATFASGSAVNFTMRALGAKGRRLFKKTVKAASIGPVTSAALRKWGIRPAIQARKASMEELAAAIVRYYKSHPHARPDR